MGMPGIWEYMADNDTDAYDAREREWFTTAKGSHVPIWSSAGADESGLGLLITCAMSIFDRTGEFLGVVGADLTFNYFIDEFLETDELKRVGAESFILDDDGYVVVRSSQKETARDVIEDDPVLFEDAAVLARTKKAQAGHAAMSNGRLAVWSRLSAIPWTYLVVAEESALLTMTGE